MRRSSLPEVDGRRRHAAGARAARAATIVLAVILAAVPSGCRSGSPAPTSPAQDYVVRGEVVRLPAAGDPAREIWLRHEAIPGFRDERGQVVGMGSMTMPFPLAEQVSVADLAVGDIVRFHLQVRWQEPTRPAAILRLDELPAETRLDFAAPGN